MKILHYIPTSNGSGITDSYVRTLSASMKKTDEVQIFTDCKEACKLIKAGTTEIVHIHACWNSDAAKVFKQAWKHNIAAVISPHWGLEAYTMHNEQPVAKLLKRIAYQKDMICKADVTVVTSQSEKDNIKALEWTKKVCYIPSCLLTDSINEQEMAEEMLIIYKKILDTRYFQFMTGIEKSVIRSLLHIALTKDLADLQISNDEIQELSMLDYTQWRRILLYADDENIRQYIEDGARKMHINMPEINTKGIDRFPVICPKDTENLNNTVLPGNYKGKKEKLKEETCDDDKSLQEICSLTLSIKHHLSKNTLSMRHLADLYEAVRYYDYDEDRLSEALGNLRMRKLFTRMLQILTESFHLTEGFTPLKPCNDKGTQAIRNLIPIKD